MKSSTLSIYERWLETATTEQIEFVDAAYKVCEDNYENGGDTICECYTPSEVIEDFSSLNEVKDFCGLKVEQSLNSRWGGDSDSELERYTNFKRWE